MPGPPRELKPLFLEEVLPRLQRRVSGVRMHKRELRVTGLGESHVEERIQPIYTRYTDVNTTILASPGEIQIHLRYWTEDAAQANETLDEMVRSFELALGDRIFAHSAASLEDVVAEILIDNRATIAAAESCTGGLLCGATDAYSRQLQLFSWRSGLLQQRTENRLGGRAPGHDRREGRGQHRGGDRASGGNSPASGQRDLVSALREWPARVVAAKKNRWARCTSRWLLRSA